MRTIDGLGNWILIIMAGASLVSMIAAFQLDIIVNQELYAYGLQFSDVWAYPYWTAIRVIFAMSWLSLIVTIGFQIYKTMAIRSIERENAEELEVTIRADNTNNKVKTIKTAIHKKKK